MGNRKKIVASLTGATAFIVAPFIHGAFSTAAANTDNSPTNVSISTTSTPSVHTSNSDSSDNSSDVTDNGEKDHNNMPVSVSTEINNGKATVTVNGESTEVKDGDSIHKTVKDDSSTTHISVTNNDGNVSATTNTTSGRTRINSHTSSSVNVTTKVKDQEIVH